MTGRADHRFMMAALALASRGRARTTPNPNVGCILEKGGRIVGRGWTQPGGRPHAEAEALAQAGDEVRGATAWVTPEPCAHDSQRRPALAPLPPAARLGPAGPGFEDPDPRTAGAGTPPGVRGCGSRHGAFAHTPPTPRAG